jgi:hypothetical protein
MRALVLPCSAIALWEVVGRSHVVQSDRMSRPSEIALAARRRTVDWRVATGESLYRAQP